MTLVDVNKTYYRVFIRVTNACFKPPNVYIHFTKVKAKPIDEVIDTSDYFIIKKQYANLPMAVIEKV